MELGWPFPKRIHFLKSLIEDGTPSYEHRIRFQGQLQNFGVYKIPLGLPRYRLENGRTYDRQAEYLAEHPDLPDDFFRADLESVDAQSVQHGFLVDLARGPKDLFAEFSKGEQSDPIILSAHGFVVNGNRRLATWRELFAEDEVLFERYRLVDAIILPLCEDRDLDQLEAQLQLRPDLKADYSWTSQALMYREKIKLYGYTEDKLAATYEIKVEELKELRDCIAYAEAYLESRSKEKHYTELDNKKYAFIQIVNTRKKMKSDEPKKEVFEKASFCLADEARAGESVYTEIKEIGANIDAIIEDLIDELELEGSEDAEERCATVADALDEPENWDAAREIIRETLVSESEKKREKRKKNFVVSQIGKARIALEAANEARDSDASKKGIIDDLERIQRIAEELMTWARDGT